MLEVSGLRGAGARAEGRELQRYGALSEMVPTLKKTLIAMCEEYGRSVLGLGSGYAGIVLAAHRRLLCDELDGPIMNQVLSHRPSRRLLPLSRPSLYNICRLVAHDA